MATASASGAFFDVTLDSTDLVRALDKAGRRADDLTPTMREIGELLVTAVSSEFQTSGRGRWPPLKPSTLAKGRYRGTLSVGSKRHARAMARYFEVRGEGGSERAARRASLKAGGIKFKKRGDSFAAPHGSDQHARAKAAWFESRGRGETEGQANKAAHKEVQRGGILQDTGQLAGSIRSEAGPDFALATTDKFYAVFHVSSAPRKIIPLRNFFDVDPATFDDAEQMLIEALTRTT